MLQIVWRFELRPEAVARFEAVYGPEGDWAVLFRNSPHYYRTSLIRKEDVPAVYEIIDEWRDKEAFDAFKREFREQYEALDKRCEDLTIKETQVGEFIRQQR